ncbi:phage/plasmid primase, P4 family (plasmid) [Streptomyces sp. NBC_01102]|uniref:DNA primase family protein n=1 Tax=Streptomyces sp. NBC_01102 TaxID=2903749 RepID=UPI0038695D5F|nr:phage/plasmid primase, P4 family [Streptomyces sp. NBC_01102]
MTEKTSHLHPVPSQSGGPEDDLWADNPAATKERPRVARAARSSRRAPEVQHRGHLRMAERFISEHHEALRFVHGIGWHEWDGSRWLYNDERPDIAYAVKTIKAGLRDLEGMSGDARDDLYKDIRKSESAGGLEGMAKIASALAPISTSSKALDADAFLFNTPDGTVQLRDGSIVDCDRSHLITKVAGAGLPTDEDGEVAGGEEFHQFLEKILPDEAVRSFVQRLVGYAMLGEVKEHVMPIFTGTGANGKGTLRDALMAAFGDYAIEVDPAILMESKHERHGAFKMRLRGARLTFCSETEKGRRFAEATMKRLVGGDPIEANLMHKNPITFDPSHTLVMLTNHLPLVSGDDPAVWRRILVVPFDVVIPENERDGGLPDRLKKAAPAVLEWAYEGWLAYREEGLAPPEAVRVRTEEYKASSDVLGRFLDERTITSPHGVAPARELFNAWTSWCHASGEQASSEVEFSKSMAARGFAHKKTNVGKVYNGLMIAGIDEDE